MMTRGALLAGVSGGGGGPVPVSELARDTTAYSDATDQSTYTTGARSIGTASATRRVYALIFATWNFNTSRTISSVTIGGVSATQRVFVQDNATIEDHAELAAIYSAVVPTGTTAVVVANFSGLMSSFACSVIALDGLISDTPQDTGSAGGGFGTTVIQTSLDLVGNGYSMAVAGAELSGASPTVTWNNLSETVDSFIEHGSTDDAFSVAFAKPSTSTPNVTVQATITNSSSNGKVLAAISVR